MNPLTWQDVGTLQSLLPHVQYQEQRALLHRLIVAADGATDVDIATAGTEAARVMANQRDTIMEQQSTIATLRSDLNQAYLDLRRATRPRFGAGLLRAMCAHAWDLGFSAGYADGTDTGETDPCNPYRSKP